MKKFNRIAQATALSIFLVSLIVVAKPSAKNECQAVSMNESITCTAFAGAANVSSVQKETSEVLIEENKSELVGVSSEETSQVESVTNVNEEISSNEIVDDQFVEEQIQIEDEEVPQGLPYTQEDVEMLAHLLFAEAGSDWISDETIYYVGSVVLNRVNSDRYPNTLKDVIYQKGQYYPARHGFMSNHPTDRCWVIAENLLKNGSVLPADVLGQSAKSIYKKYGKELYCVSDTQYFYTL